MWHGQHFMTPFVRERASSFLVPVAHGTFGSVYAQTFAELGLEVIRGSRRTGGFKVFREMIRALENGASVGLTVDSQPVAKVVGDGVLALARHSGRPIIPVVTATSRQLVLTWRWDRPVINLPFGRLAVAIGSPISVSHELNLEYLEDKRQELRRALSFLNLRATELTKPQAQRR